MLLDENVEVSRIGTVLKAPKMRETPGLLERTFDDLDAAPSLGARVTWRHTSPVRIKGRCPADCHEIPDADGS